MSNVEIETRIGAEICCSRGLSEGTIIVEIDTVYIFFNSEGVNSLREFISQEIEKGWIK